VSQPSWFQELKSFKAKDFKDKRSKIIETINSVLKDKKSTKYIIVIDDKTSEYALPTADIPAVKDNTSTFLD
jgi:hypothetical protein